MIIIYVFCYFRLQLVFEGLKIGLGPVNFRAEIDETKDDD